MLGVAMAPDWGGESQLVRPFSGAYFRQITASAFRVKTEFVVCPHCAKH